MGPESQNILIKIPEQPEVVEREVRAAVRLRTVDRDQTLLVQIWVDELIAADQARAIWELAGQLDLSKFKEPLKSRQGGAGRAAWDPRLLVSLWVYAYSEGVSSARERKERLDAAMDEWKKMAEGCTEKQKEDLRVSMTEPEARRMKHGDNAITPGYNAQISTSKK